MFIISLYIYTYTNIYIYISTDKSMTSRTGLTGQTKLVEKNMLSVGTIIGLNRSQDYKTDRQLSSNYWQLWWLLLVKFGKSNYSGKNMMIHEVTKLKSERQFWDSCIQSIQQHASDVATWCRDEIYPDESFQMDT